ncbi:hypothetical protein LPJ56_006085, partial [Coemansia sp. RSA 2599]
SVARLAGLAASGHQLRRGQGCCAAADSRQPGPDPLGCALVRGARGQGARAAGKKEV